MLLFCWRFREPSTTVVSPAVEFFCWHVRYFSAPQPLMLPHHVHALIRSISEDQQCHMEAHTELLGVFPCLALSTEARARRVREAGSHLQMLPSAACWGRLRHLAPQSLLDSSIVVLMTWPCSSISHGAPVESKPKKNKQHASSPTQRLRSHEFSADELLLPPKLAQRHESVPTTRVKIMRGLRLYPSRRHAIRVLLFCTTDL